MRALCRTELQRQLKLKCSADSFSPIIVLFAAVEGGGEGEGADREKQKDGRASERDTARLKKTKRGECRGSTARSEGKDSRQSGYTGLGALRSRSSAALKSLPCELLAAHMMHTH